MEENIKQILNQLGNLKRELKDTQERIMHLDTYIKKLEEDGYSEKDSVTGGEGGIQHFTIEGYPYPLYTQKKTLLQRKILNREELKGKIEYQIIQAEEFISKCNDSKIRRLLTYRYIDELSWVQVAHKMGKHHTADSCQKTVERFLKKF